MPTLTLHNRLTITGCTPEELEALRREFTYDNPDRQDIKRLENAVRANPRNFKLRGMLSTAMKAPPEMATYTDGEAGSIALARGSVERAQDILATFGRSSELVDQRSEGDSRLGPVRGTLTHEPWDFQHRMLEAAISGEQGMVLGETGCGKTQFGFMFANACKVPVIVLVHSSALMADWVRRAKDELQLRDDDIGEIQGSTRRIRPLTIAMVQTVVRHGREFAGKFGCVIADEIERFAAKSLYESADLFPARYRIGIGADFKRKDGKEFLTADLFGGVLIQVSREEIGDKILDVEHRLFETGWAPDWYVALPRSARGYAFNQLVDSAMASKERNALLARVAGAEVQAGNPVLAFSHRREHVRLLEADLRREVPGLAGTATGVMLGGKPDQAEFDRCTAGFRAGTLKFAGTTYMAASVGINLPSLPVGMCATPTHSNPSRLRQTQGRLRRIAKGKDTARLYVPWDRGCFGLAPVRASLRMAPEKTFVLVEGKWVNARDFLRTARDDEHEDGPEAASDLFTAVR